MNNNSLVCTSLLFLAVCTVANGFGAHIDLDTIKQIVLAILAKYGVDSTVNSKYGEHPN